MKPEKPGRTFEMTAAVRRQTPQEQRRFEAALELVLTELVRREIASRRKAKNENGEVIEG